MKRLIHYLSVVLGPIIIVLCLLLGLLKGVVDEVFED